MSIKTAMDYCIVINVLILLLITGLSIIYSVISPSTIPLFIILFIIAMAIFIPTIIFIDKVKSAGGRVKYDLYVLIVFSSIITILLYLGMLVFTIYIFKTEVGQSAYKIFIFLNLLYILSIVQIFIYLYYYNN